MRDFAFKLQVRLQAVTVCNFRIDRGDAYQQVFRKPCQGCRK